MASTDLVLPRREEIDRLVNVEALEAKGREIAETAAVLRERCTTREEADALHRDLKALHAVLTAKRAKVPEVTAEMERTKTWIGKLLGKAKMGRPKVSTVDTLETESEPQIHDRDKHDWRLMAEHEAVVEKMIEERLAAGKIVEHKPIIRHIRDLDAAKARKEAKLSLPEHNLYTCYCADLAQHVEPGSVDVIITDPPYPKEYLDTYAELSEFAAHALRPGGLCVSLAGQSYLPDVIERLGHRLTYHWTVCYWTPGGQASGNRQRGVNSSWKPALVYSNGEHIAIEGDGSSFGDVVKSNVNDNDAGLVHEWGQSMSGTLDLVRRFSHPGDLVCDPFLGSGTVAAASLFEGRRFVGCDIEEEWIAETQKRLGL